MPSSINFGFELFALSTFLIYIAIIGLVIYFMISTIIFFRKKTKNDEELLNKLDELIRLLKKD